MAGGFPKARFDYKSLTQPLNTVQQSTLLLLLFFFFMDDSRHTSGPCYSFQFRGLFYFRSRNHSILETVTVSGV